MPKLRATIGRWSPRDCDPLIALLESWMPLIPSWVTDNILDQFVLPRVQREVESWDPTTDTMPIHSWIHPWFPLMGMCMYMYTCTVQVIKKCPDVLSVLLSTDSTTVRSTVSTTVHSTVSITVHSTVSITVHSTVSTTVHSTVSITVHSTVSTYVRYASKKSVR